MTTVTILDNEVTPLPVVTLDIQQQHRGTVDKPIIISAWSSQELGRGQRLWLRATNRLAPHLVNNDVEAMEVQFVASPAQTLLNRRPYSHTAAQYSVTWIPTRAGNYTLELLHLYSNGLRGTYFRDSHCQSLLFTRIDDRLNFTWTAAQNEEIDLDGGRTQPFLSSVTSFGSIRWQGFLLAPSATELTTVSVNTTGSVRLWLDGTCIDEMY